MRPQSVCRPGEIPVRLEGFAGYGPIAGLSMWRGVKDFEHGTLCRAFNLDPCRFYFDLPSSARGVGSYQSGAGGSGRGRRLIRGFVMCVGLDKPVAKLSEVTATDRFWDGDPLNESDFFDLNRT